MDSSLEDRIMIHVLKLYRRSQDEKIAHRFGYRVMQYTEALKIESPSNFATAGYMFECLEDITRHLNEPIRTTIEFQRSYTLSMAKMDARAAKGLDDLMVALCNLYSMNKGDWVYATFLSTLLPCAWQDAVDECIRTDALYDEFVCEIECVK